MAMRQISEKDFMRLINAEKLLLALQECGVDNWEGYSEAVRIAFPDEGEDEDGQ